jgi:hypothetical protein
MRHSIRKKKSYLFTPLYFWRILLSDENNISQQIITTIPFTYQNELILNKMRD